MLGFATRRQLGVGAQAMQPQCGRPPVRRLVCAPLCAKKGKQQGSSKANKRGKPAAPASPQAAQQQQQQQQQPTAVAQPAPASPVQQQEAPRPAQQPSSPQQQQQQPPSGGAGRRPLTETPQVVVDRMFRRVVTFAGLPVVTGMLLFPAFWYLRVVQKVDYPIWIVYVTQALMFGGGLAGISYGILSTSWDPRREGSALGWTELQANLPVLLDRSKNQQDDQK